MAICKTVQIGKLGLRRALGDGGSQVALMLSTLKSYTF